MKQSSTGRQGNVGITLDNMRAMTAQDKGIVDPESSECIFVQAFHELHGQPDTLWRGKLDNKQKLFAVKYMGEDGMDWGGVFRDAVNRMVEDLCSPRLDLLTLCPNGRIQDGINTDAYLPNPRHTSPRTMAMFEFVGKLMAMSLRFKLCLPFELPSLVWKQLVGQPLDRSDLTAVDTKLGKDLAAIEAFEGDDAAFAAEFPDLVFSINSLDGRPMDLKPGGAAMAVTTANRLEYVRLVEVAKLHEFDAQIAAIRRGLVSCIPARAVRLLTWQELDLHVSGRPEIDVDALKAHTEYEGCVVVWVVVGVWVSSDTVLVLCRVCVFADSAVTT